MQARHSIAASVRPQQQLNSELLAFESRRKAIHAYAQRKQLNPVDLEVLRQLFLSHALDQCEAEALFALDATLCGANADYDAFFVSLLSSHVIWDLRPTGVVNEAQSEWLVRQCDKARTPARMALLSNVLAEAHRVPGWFAPVVRARLAAFQRAAEPVGEAAGLTITS
ncbi:MAG: hypothetical protein KGQ46_07300 [Hyphomicrobiales bacterium]|nr:hypothetical protein [Hyphomicrobiales bacterium]MDE2113987.1 hypothetical protein [Hyphomicrobiales bacterium]